MTNIWTWVAVLLVGILILAAYPFIPAQATVAETGMFPEWLIPVGYFISGIGAAGAFFAWTWNRRER